MQGIDPLSWFGDNAEEALLFCGSLFERSNAGAVRRCREGPGPKENRALSVRPRR